MQDDFQQLNKPLLGLIGNFQKKELRNLNHHMYHTRLFRFITLNIAFSVLLLWSTIIHAQKDNDSQSLMTKAFGTLDDIFEASIISL